MKAFKYISIADIPQPIVEMLSVELLNPCVGNCFLVPVCDLSGFSPDCDEHTQHYLEYEKGFIHALITVLDPADFNIVDVEIREPLCDASANLIPPRDDCDRDYTAFPADNKIIIEK
jgi:hypothetical protein